MKPLARILTLWLVFSLVHPTAAPLDSHALKPPQAKKVPKIDRIHGDARLDNYFWMRDKANPEVLTYLEAENAYTEAVMKSSAPLQESLYKEMLARIKETDLTVPYREGNYYYYSRTEKGKQYPIYCRKLDRLTAAEEVTLDLNALAGSHKFLAMGRYAVSPDGNRLVYSIDITGSRDYTLYVKDLRNGQLYSDRIEKVHFVVWQNDNQHLLYVTEDAAKRPYRLYRHALGQARDELVYEEKDELFELSVSRSRSQAYIFVTSASLTTTEVRYLPAAPSGGTGQVIRPREPNHEYSVDHSGDFFYILTNDGGRNFRLVSAPVARPGKENWKEIIPHRPNVMLEGLDCFARHYVVYEREGGIPTMRIANIRTGQTHRMEFPDPVYETSPGPNREFNTPVLRFSYESFTTPNSVFDYNMDSRRRELLKQTEVLGGYDSSSYKSERRHATASDGVPLPVSLVYKRGMRRAGPQPMLLTGYGAYGSVFSIEFSSGRLSLLDRGLIFAVAHVRGGGELGKTWHDQGRMRSKRNTFTDFIAAAEYLMAEKYTDKSRLIIQGTSAGGLLMGAVVNMRPDLFNAVIVKVPFVDVINTMLDSSLPLTVGEYEEWGNPNIKEEYDYIKTYCPYTNITAKAYPTMLVRTSLNDTLVSYWEPAKYVAKLRATKTDRNLLMLRTNMGAGHGGASGRYDALRETAFDYAFILSQLGLH